MKTLFTITAILIIGAFAYYFIPSIIKSQEIFECQTLQNQSVEFRNAGFYITSWQDEMCRNRNIIINAEVK